MPDQNNPFDNQNPTPDDSGVVSNPEKPEETDNNLLPFPEDTSIPPISPDMIKDSPTFTPSQTISDSAPLPNPDGSTGIPPMVPSLTPKKKFGGKKMIATILGILVLLGSLGAGIILVKQQQDIREKAGTLCPKDCLPQSQCKAGTQVGGVGYGDCGAGEYCCEKATVAPTLCPKDCVSPQSQCKAGTQVGGVSYGDCGIGEYCCEKATTTPTLCPYDCVPLSQCTGTNLGLGYGDCGAALGEYCCQTGGGPTLCPKDCVSPQSQCKAGTQVGGVSYGDCGIGEYCCDKATTTPGATPTPTPPPGVPPTPPACPTTKSFPDVTETSPYYEAVTSLAGAPCCSIAGYADGTFKPNQNITRAEAVTFIAAYHVYVLGDWEWTLTPTPSFPDVPTTHFAYVFIETAKTYGFIAGLLDGTFKPNDEWLYGFCGINKPCSSPGPTITRGAYIQKLWDYGVTNNQVDQCKLVESTPTCQNIKAYDTNWGPIIIAQLSTLKPGDKIRFTVSGTPANKIDKARFIINGTTRPETTNKAPWPDVFYDEYTIPAGVTSFTVNAQLHHITLGWF